MYTILYPELESKLRDYQVTIPSQDDARTLGHSSVSVPATPAPALLHTSQIAEDPATAVGDRHNAPVHVAPGLPWPSRIWQALTMISIRVGIGRVRWMC
jgi:hypothetical protein